MALQLATKEVGFAKGGIYGPKGTGKTTLMAMLLIHLSKTYHNSAPVAWLASEKGVDFVIDIFAAEKVPLLLTRSRSFVDLLALSREAITAGACAAGVDSVSHYWSDLFTAGMKARGPRLQRIGRIKEEWAPFAQDFQDSNIHFLVTGRMGFVWDEVEIEDDKGELVKELSKGGTKMKAEGDFGHEPDLEIETSQIDDPDLVRFDKIRGKARRNFKSQMIHVATVKKCRVWALNGQAFTWKDVPGYKPDYYKKVADPFRPYFDAINIGGVHAAVHSERPSAAVLFENGSEQSRVEWGIKKDIALEKWQATMDLIAGGQTKENIHKRAVMGEAITGTRSRTEFERQSLDSIVRQVQVLMTLEHRLLLDAPKNDEELLACCAMAIEDVDHPGKSLTLLEAMSTSKANGQGQPEAMPF
jgi:hypothetical protein